MGYGEAKQALYDAAMEYFGPSFTRREDLEKHPDDVEDVLRQGAETARAKGKEVLTRVRKACGLK
jgi:tryptophanyl-tRNA synthetase